MKKYGGKQVRQRKKKPTVKDQQLDEYYKNLNYHSTVTDGIPYALNKPTPDKDKMTNTNETALTFTNKAINEDAQILSQGTIDKGLQKTETNNVTNYTVQIQKRGRKTN